jgi:hypothetical protein
MRHQGVEVLFETSTSAVIRLPGRELPGVVVSGDVLVKMLEDAQDLYDQVQAYARQASLAHELVAALTAHVSLYNSVTKRQSADSTTP